MRQGNGLITALVCGLALVLLTSAPGQAEKSIIQSVQADFNQEKHLPILAHPLKAKGIFLFQAPDSIRWEYQQPLASILLMYHGKVHKFVQKNGLMQEERGRRVDAMQVVLTEIQDWLKGEVAHSATFNFKRQDAKTIILTPKDKGLTAIINKIELKMGQTKGLLDQVTIYEGPKAFTRLTFSKRVLNKTIPAVRFRQP